MSELGKTLGGHIDELRARLFRCALAGTLVFAALYAMKDVTYEMFVRPVGVLVYLGPAGAFMIHMKLALVGAAILVLPYVLHQIYAFVAPALEAPQRKILAAGSVFSMLLFYLGAFMGWMLLDRALNFLTTFSTDTLQPMVSTDTYFGFVSSLVIGCGLIFQIPIVTAIITRLGWLGSSTLKREWRKALVGSLLLSALITPSPDAITQILLALPIFGLYGTSIFVSVFIERRERLWAAEAS